MKYRIEAPGQPTVVADYRDEMEARTVVRASRLVPDMSTVKITPLYDEYFAELRAKKEADGEASAI